MNVKRFQILGVLLIALLAGCADQPAAPQPEAISSTQPAAPQPEALRPPVPTPSAGVAVVVGQAIGNTTQAPIKKTYVYLAKVFWDKDHKNAAFALDIAHSPVATTDQNGYFTFNQIEPSEYVLVVGDYYGNNDVVREKNGDARVYKPEAGKSLDVGVVQVNASVTPAS
jgi:hypothetical protein